MEKRLKREVEKNEAERKCASEKNANASEKQLAKLEKVLNVETIQEVVGACWSAT